MSQRGQAFCASSAKYRPPGPPPTIDTFMANPLSGFPSARDAGSVGDDGRGFDFELRPVLDQPGDLHHRHRRVVLADQFAVGGADLVDRAEVLLLVGDVPGHADDVLGPAARLCENGQGVAQRLAELAGKRPLLEDALRIEGHLSRDVDGGSASCGDAVRIALRAHPAGRLQDPDHGALLPSVLSLKRCSLPVSVRGSEATNSTSRGYLYGAMF